MCQAVTNTRGTLAASIEVERVGNGNDVHGGHGDQFAVAAIDGVAEHGELAALILQSGNALRAVIAEMHGRDQHALAGLEVGDVFADFDDFAGDVAAENVRQVHAGQALAHPEVEMVQGAGAHADQNLVFARLGIGNVFVGENFGSTELMNANGFHEAPKSQSVRTVWDQH